jgi:hypothetical protein
MSEEDARRREALCKRRSENKEKGDAMDSITPSLTTDDDEDRSSKSGITARSVSPLFEGSSFRAVGEGGITSPIHESYLEFDEYLSRSQRHPLSVSGLATWHSWSWDHLKAPVYDVASSSESSSSSSSDDDSSYHEDPDKMDLDVGMDSSWKRASRSVGTLFPIAENGHLVSHA